MFYGKQNHYRGGYVPQSDSSWEYIWIEVEFVEEVWCAKVVKFPIGGTEIKIELWIFVI